MTQAGATSAGTRRIPHTNTAPSADRRRAGIMADAALGTQGDQRDLEAVALSAYIFADNDQDHLVDEVEFINFCRSSAEAHSWLSALSRASATVRAKTTKVREVGFTPALTNSMAMMSPRMVQKTRLLRRRLHALRACVLSPRCARCVCALRAQRHYPLSPALRCKTSFCGPCLPSRAGKPKTGKGGELPQQPADLFLLALFETRFSFCCSLA